MFFYRFKGKILISEVQYPLVQITETDAVKEEGPLYALTQIDPKKSRRLFVVTDPEFAFLKSEDIHLLRKPDSTSNNIPGWLASKIDEHKLISLNTSYPDWDDWMEEDILTPHKWHVNVVGLGDVGGIVVTGLRLLGSDCIDHIGIYDVDQNKTERWVYEVGQVQGVDEDIEYPKVMSISEQKLFDCHMFVFCVSAGVPEVGKEAADVRMVQFQRNSKIIESYAKAARMSNFKGIFAVVSDPVDLLCKSAYISSNTDAGGEFDNKGLYPEQVRGYGLGVMNARARFFAEQSLETKHYKSEGRVFGPHGEGLVVADSIINYNEKISDYLTEKTLKANLNVRALGFKPYIAPALSSGSLSLIATMEGKWHYSSTFLGGVFMGAKNRFTPFGTEIEAIPMDDKLFNRLSNSYERLHQLL